jgi:hypothetical protein
MHMILDILVMQLQVSNLFTLYVSVKLLIHICASVYA